MVNQTQAAGINLSPIQGPRLNTGLQGTALTTTPFFQGMAQGRANIQQREDIYNTNQELALKAMKQQQDAFKTATGGIGSTNMYGLEFDATTAKGREAQQRLLQYQKEAQENSYRIMSGGMSSGKVDAVGMARETQRSLVDMQQKILNDADLFAVSKVQKDRKKFIDALDVAESKGAVIDRVAAMDALGNADAYLNDVSGEVKYTPEVFNPAKYAYDPKVMNASINQLITNAVGETKLIENIKASSIPGFEEADGVVSQTLLVQNEKEKAQAIIKNRLLADPNMASYLRARGYVNPDAYINDRMEEFLNPIDRQVIEQKGITEANNFLAQADKDEAAMAREKEETRRKGITNEFSSTSSRYNFDTKTEKGAELAALAESINSLSDTFEASESTIRSIQKFIDSSDGKYNYDDVQLKEDGTFGIYKEQEDGTTKEVETFGKGVKAQRRYDNQYKKASTKKVFEDFENMDAGTMGVYSDAIQGYEQRAKSGSGPSSKEDETGVYSYRLEPDGNATYGTHQMYGGTWNGFVKSINKELGLGLTAEDMAKLDATKGANTKEDVFSFIEKTTGDIGEDRFEELEQKYLMGTRWFPTIEKAESRFGVELSNQLRTWVADAANQHGNAGGEYLDMVEEDLDSTGGSPKEEQDLLRSMYNARVKYLKKYSSNVSDAELESIINNRYVDLYNKLNADLTKRGPDYSRGNIGLAGSVQPNQQTGTAPTTPPPSPEQVRVMGSVNKFLNSGDIMSVPPQDGAAVINATLKTNDPITTRIGQKETEGGSVEGKLKEIERTKQASGLNAFQEVERLKILHRELVELPTYKSAIIAATTPPEYFIAATKQDVTTLLKNKELVVGGNKFKVVEADGGGYGITYITPGNLIFQAKEIDSAFAADELALSNFLVQNNPEAYMDEAQKLMSENKAQTGSTPTSAGVGKSEAYTNAYNQLNENIPTGVNKQFKVKSDKYEPSGTYSIENNGVDEGFVYVVRLKGRDGGVQEFKSDTKEALSKMVEEAVQTSGTKKANPAAAFFDN